MTHIGKILALAILAGITGAIHVAHERRLHAPQWEKQTRAPADATVPVRVALAQRNLKRGHDLLMAASDPDSPTYGQHLTHAEIAQLFEPDQATVERVRDWLAEEGLSRDRHIYRPGRGVIDFEATVAEVEKLLRTRYHVYEHRDTGDKHVSVEQYYLPRHIRPHVDFVTPTVVNSPLHRRDGFNGPYIRPMKTPHGYHNKPPPGTNGTNQTDCGTLVTTKCIRAMYNIPQGTSNATGNQIGIFAKDDSWNARDLDLFFQNEPGSHVPSGTRPEVRSIDGGVAPAPNNQVGFGECLLDLEVAMPIVYPQGTVDWQVDDPRQVPRGYVDIFLDALDASFCTYEGGDSKVYDEQYPDPNGYNHPEMCGTYKPTNVISVSYSEDENQRPPL